MPATRRENLKFYIILLLLFISILIFDRYSKYYVLSRVSPFQSIPIIKNIFHISLVKNTGIAFGMFKDSNLIFTFISIFAVLLIINYFKQPSLNKNFKLALVLILSGAVGNLIDRIRWGYVVDFLDFRIWPVFNVADISISCGVFLVIYSLFIKK